ncbi:MAG: ferritin-like domain-containing protein [Bacillota bacterium]
MTPYTLGSSAHPNRYQLMIPQMPILGPHDFDRLLDDILQSIADEATAADFYARLREEAPDSLHGRFITHAYEDELEHLEAFEALYRHFTRMEPQYTIEPVEYATYEEGILMALEDELEAGEFYRDVILSTTDQLVRDTFFLAMVDELEHATQFGVLYGTL